MESSLPRISLDVFSLGAQSPTSNQTPNRPISCRSSTDTLTLGLSTFSSAAFVWMSFMSFGSSAVVVRASLSKLSKILSNKIQKQQLLTIFNYDFPNKIVILFYIYFKFIINNKEFRQDTASLPGV